MLSAHTVFLNVENNQPIAISSATSHAQAHAQLRPVENEAEAFFMSQTECTMACLWMKTCELGGNNRTRRGRAAECYREERTRGGGAAGRNAW